MSNVLVVTPEFSATKFAESHVVNVLASIRAPTADVAERAPLDLSIVVDRSGSMGGDKLRMTLFSVGFVIDQLSASDRFALVSFDSDVRTDVAMAFATADNKRRAKSAIKSMRAGSMTNLSGGLLEGLQQLASTAKADTAAAASSSSPSPSARVSSCILLTDGHANVGISSSDGIVKAARGFLSKPELASTTLFCFGYGESHNEQLLSTLATEVNSNGGQYVFLTQKEEVVRAFGDVLGGLLSVAMQNIQLRIDATSGAKVVKLFGANDLDATTTETSTVVRLGDLYSGEQRDVLVALELPAVEEATDKFSFANVNLTAFDVVASAPVDVDSKANVARVAEPTDEQKRSHVDVVTNVTRVEFAERLAEATSTSSPQVAREKLEALKTMVTRRAAASPMKQEFVDEMMDDVTEVIADCRTQAEYSAKARKKGVSYAKKMHKQRNNCYSKPMQSTFTTTTKQGYGDKAMDLFN